MIYNLDILLPLDTLGVLPVLLFLVSGSTPGRLIFCQWEYSRRSGIVLPGVLPKRLFLYTGSDLDMIYILLPLDTLGVLPVLLFLVSGSTPGRLIMSGSLPVYKNSFFGSTPGSTIPLLREYSHVIDTISVESLWNYILWVEDNLASIMASDIELSREAGDVTGMLVLNHKGLRWMSRLG